MPYISIGRKGLSDELDRLKKSDIEDQYLESWELKEVLSIVRKYNEQYACIFEFQALTGMRIGEVLGLKEEAIDFNKNIASVIRTRATHGGASEDSYEGNVKNLQSYRNVQLSKRAIEILKEEIELNHQHIRFNPDYKDNGWIFTSKSIHKPDYNGTPLHYSVLNNFLNSSENGKLNRNGNPRRAGIDIDNKLSFKKHITTHIFRHTHISFLAEQGVPLEAIQDRVGHSRGSRVTEIYLHITKKTKDQLYLYLILLHNKCGKSVAKHKKKACPHWTNPLFSRPAISSGGLRKPLNGRGSFIRYFHNINIYIIFDTHNKTHTFVIKIIYKISFIYHYKITKIYKIFIFIIIICINTFIIINIFIIFILKITIKIILKFITNTYIIFYTFVNTFIIIKIFILYIIISFNL